MITTENILVSLISGLRFYVCVALFSRQTYISVSAVDVTLFQRVLTLISFSWTYILILWIRNILK